MFLIEETNLMKISVTSKDPILSFKTVGAIMDNYADLSEYLTSDAVFDPLEAPIVPTLQTIHLCLERNLFR